MKKTTIKDLANLIGVSTSTISRALNNHPDISPELTQKIQEVAKGLNYRPSPAALQLRRGTNKTVALILPEITSFFYPSVIHGVDSVLHPLGYNLMILPTYDRLDYEKENIDIAYDQNVAGVLFAVSKETMDLGHLQRFDPGTTPVILIDKVKEDGTYTSITIDDFRVSYQMVQHLFKTGCTRIAGIFGKANLLITHLRYKGFAQALKDLGLPFHEQMARFANNSEEARSATFSLMQEWQPDGLYLMTDEIMLGAMPALNQLNVRIPEQLGVIAISDGHLPHFTIPSVSHMLHSGYELGSMSAQKLIQYINAVNHNLPFTPPERVKMNVNIVLLNSTKDWQGRED